MRKNPKVQAEHPADKELVRFVEGKSPTTESHVKSCRVCARKVKLICDDEEKMQQVQLDIKIGGVLERFAPTFQRLSRIRVMAKSISRGKQKPTESRATLITATTRTQ